MKRQAIKTPDDELDEERAMIKQIIRAHLLCDQSTAFCRDIISLASNRNMAVSKMALLSDDEFIKEFSRWTKPR